MFICFTLILCLECNLHQSYQVEMPCLTQLRVVTVSLAFMLCFDFNNTCSIMLGSSVVVNCNCIECLDSVSLYHCLPLSDKMWRGEVFPLILSHIASYCLTVNHPVARIWVHASYCFLWVPGGQNTGTLTYHGAEGSNIVSILLYQ